MRTLGNGAVEVELGSADWTVRWPGVGVALGPAAVLVDAGADSPLLDAAGSWHVETTRTGARARWSSADRTVWCELLVPIDGEVVEVQAGWTPSRDARVRAIGVAGTVTPAPGSMLVNGYDSWSYAGVRSDDTDSWWSATFAAGPAALAVQALSAERLATRIERRGASVTVAGGPSPHHRPLDGTWGFETEPDPYGVHVGAGEEIVSEPVALTAGTDPFAPTEQLAALLPRRAWSGAPQCGWESWYHYAFAIDPTTLLGNAQLLRERLGDRPGFGLLQVDDGWQVTYGSWEPNERFPSDLGDLVEEIHGLGLRGGLWLAPFMVQPGAPGLGAEHEDWCVVDPTTGATALDRHGRWALDASRPEVVAFLRELGEQVAAWDVDMVKLDFLYLGAREGLRHDARVSGTEALRRGMRAFVDALGDDVYVLGCGAPMLPMVGICHGNRIGHDLAIPVIARDFGQPLADGWSGWHGIKAQARQAAARWSMHGRWFHDDPEIVMAWGSDGRGGDDGYSLEEAHTQAVVAALTGGPFLLADDLAALLPEERAVLEDPAVLDLAWDERGFRPVDLFDRPDTAPARHAYADPTDLSSVWVAERRDGAVTALFNWTDAPVTRRAPDGGSIDVPPHAARVVPGRATA